MTELLNDFLTGSVAWGVLAYAGGLWTGCAHQPGDRKGHL